MDPALKEVLKANRSLLIMNMIPCEDFYAQLVQHNVFPGSMMYEIKTCISAEEKNAKMLELLGVRGSSVLPRFCDALQLSNHNFLADFLRDEVASRASGVRSETNDVFRKFPKLDKLLTDQDKDELLTFLSRKMKEEVIRQGWRREPGAKEKALDAKQRQLEESFRSKELLREKEQIIEQLQEKLTEAAVELREKGLEIKHLTNYIEDVRNKNQKELETQIHYNVANEKSLRRLTDREVDVNKHLKEMIGLMENSLTKYGYKQKDPRERVYAVNNIDKAKSTLYLLLQMIDEYDLIKTKCMHLLEERRMVLLFIGASTGDLEKDVDEVNLLEVVKSFAINKDDNIFNLKRELTSMTDKFEAIEGTAEETVHLRDMMVTLRDDIIAKEEVITELTEDNEDLRSRLVRLQEEAAKAEGKGKEEKPSRPRVTFPSPGPPSGPPPQPKKSVSFPSPTPQPKKSVSFPSPTPQPKKSVSFPSPTPSHLSNRSQGPKRKKTPFKQVRIRTPVVQTPVSETDSSDFDTEAMPQFKLRTHHARSKDIVGHGSHAAASAAAAVGTTVAAAAAAAEAERQKMKFQFNLPTNHSTRLGAVLAQGMYLPPLMDQGMDLRISGPSGPTAVAKTLNAAHTKLKPNLSMSQSGLGIGGTQITNGMNHTSASTSALITGSNGNQRTSGQAKVLRVSSLAPSNKQGNRKTTNSTHFAYHAPYGAHQSGAGNTNPANRNPPKRTLWR